MNGAAVTTFANLHAGEGALSASVAVIGLFDFAGASDRVRQDLLKSLHGGGAFRHFNDTVRQYQMVVANETRFEASIPSSSSRASSEAMT